MDERKQSVHLEYVLDVKMSLYDILEDANECEVLNQMCHVYGMNCICGIGLVWVCFE